MQLKVFYLDCFEIIEDHDLRAGTDTFRAQVVDPNDYSSPNRM
jgi:hypothetical protein